MSARNWLVTAAVTGHHRGFGAGHGGRVVITVGKAVVDGFGRGGAAGALVGAGFLRRGGGFLSVQGRG
jgi:hypothetical protein